MPAQAGIQSTKYSKKLTHPYHMPALAGIQSANYSSEIPKYLTRLLPTQE